MAEPYPHPRATPDEVTIPWTEYRALVLDAAHWRHLNTSPHVAELLAEWVEWDRRRIQTETSHAISAVADWKTIANHPTYAELDRRRGEVRLRCTADGCDQKELWPAPGPDQPRCRRHGRDQMSLVPSGLTAAQIHARIAAYFGRGRQAGAA
jgi:hypothetical protein